MDYRDNVIEWEPGQSKACASFYSKRFVNKIKKLAKKYPNEVDFIENKDGSVYCHFPLNYVKITKPAHREVSEEQRLKAAERFAEYRRKKGEKKDGVISEG